MDTRTWPPGPSNVFLCLKHQLSRWFPGSERGVNGRERARMRQYGTTESSAPGTRETREAREGAHAKTRLVIRRLPPGLTSSEFHAALASESCPCQLSSVDFVAGSESKAYMGNRYVGGGWHTRVALRLVSSVGSSVRRFVRTSVRRFVRTSVRPYVGPS
jgi:hypothetical protein